MSKPTPVNRYSGQVFEFLTVLDTPVTVVRYPSGHGLTHQEVLNHYAGVQ